MRTLLALTLLAPLASAQSNCPTLFDINPLGSAPFGASSTPSALTVQSDELVFFRADDGVHGYELWSVGPIGSPALVKDLNPITNGFPRDLHPHWDGTQWRTFFSALGANGYELHVTDGTAAGTHEVVDLMPGSAGGIFWNSEVDPMGSLDGEVYFPGQSPQAGGFELYASDGTAGGTRLVKELSPGADSSYPRRFVPLGGKLYFIALQPGPSPKRRALWRTDGQAAGTHQLASSDQGGTSFTDMTPVGSVLFFNGRLGDGSLGRELYAALPDDSVVLVDDHLPGAQSGDPEGLTAFDGRLVYAASNGSGMDLMVVDPATLLPQSIGTVAGPELWMVPGDQHLYFGGQLVAGGGYQLGRWDGTNPVELVVTPGLVFDVNASGVAVGDDVFFRGRAVGGNDELFHLDGETTMVTQVCASATIGTLPSELHLMGSSLFYGAFIDGGGYELARLDLLEAVSTDLGPENTPVALSATAPHLGGTVELKVDGAGSGQPVVLGWSIATSAYSTPLLAPGAAAWLDPISFQIFAVVVGGAPQVVTSPVPSTPALAGLKLHAQAFELPFATFPALASNGVALTLGS
ncbi:MAG: hypothetical protein P1V81_09590 [Planctomycetota bacterium]|nr:hypothetical protein [Planctomycetota bacterium]